MDADHKKHKNRITLRQWTPEEHLVKVCQSKLLWDSRQSQPNRKFHKVMHINRPYSTKTQYAVKKSRSISKVSSWRDKRLYCIQKVNLSPRPTEVDLSTLPVWKETINLSKGTHFELWRGNYIVDNNLSIISFNMIPYFQTTVINKHINDKMSPHMAANMNSEKVLKLSKLN